MSLARLALRLAAIEAICPAATVADGPYLTIAGPRVYDSRIDPIEGEDDLASVEGKALVTVYTEEDHKRPYNFEATNYPVGEQLVELVVEIMIATRGTLDVETPDGQIETFGTLEAPITDREHEATLDVLESVVRYLFEAKNAAPSAALFRKIAMEVRDVRSVPQRAADRTVRMAARTVKFLCKVKTDAWAPGAAAGTLPVPLSLVAAALPAGSTGGALLAKIAAAMPAVPGSPLPGDAGQIALFGGLARVPIGADAEIVANVATQT